MFLMNANTVIDTRKPKKKLNLNCSDCNKSLEDCTCIESTIDMNKLNLKKNKMKTG